MRNTKSLSKIMQLVTWQKFHNFLRCKCKRLVIIARMREVQYAKVR